jgi:hypothetical protein
MGNSGQADYVSDLVLAARAGDVAAYGKLVQATQAMSMAVALDVLHEPTGADARDAADVWRGASHRKSGP